MEKVQSKRRIINITNRELPPNIVKVIFSKLPFSNLSVCRQVCKTWNHLVLDYASSSEFLPNAFLLCTSDVIPNANPPSDWCNPKMHCVHFDTMNYVASFKFDSEGWMTISIVNSCNGLLHISKRSYNKWCNEILNPMTNDFIKLPQVDEDIYYFGFGFSPKTKQYKLFRFSADSELTSVMEVCRFGERNNNQRFGRSNNNQLQWRHIFDDQPFICYNNGAYLDGFIYWIGKDLRNEFVIYGLNVETERIESIAILNVSIYSTIHHAFIQPLNGTIYAAIRMTAPFWKIHVWKMATKDSWIRSHFVIDLSNDSKVRFFSLIKVFDDERQLLFLLNNDIFCLDKIGRKINIKTFNPFNPNGKVEVVEVSHIQSLNFGSLPSIFGDHCPFFV